MAKRERVAVLDPGPTAVTCMLGETTDTGQMRVVGWSRMPAEGWRNGSVVHPEHATQTTLAAWQAATKMAGVRLDNVYVSVTGEHIRSIRGKGSIAVARPRKGISGADIQAVVEQAKAIALPQDQQILHVIPIQFIVDGQKGVVDPKGLFGTRLEVEVHIIIVAMSVIENIHRIVGSTGLHVRGLLLRGMAAALGGTELDERRMGVAAVHVGALTEVVIYRECSVRHNATLLLGGTDITSDISMVLRIPQPLAERVKLEYGAALASQVENDEPITLQVQNSSRQVSRRLLASVIEPRAEEVLRHVEAEIRRSGLAEFLAGGVVLTGGTSRLPGIEALAEQVLNLPVRAGSALGMLGPDEVLKDPSLVPAAGLVRFGLSGGRDMGNAMIPVKAEVPFLKNPVRWFKALLSGERT